MNSAWAVESRPVDRTGLWPASRRQRWVTGRQWVLRRVIAARPTPSRKRKMARRTVMRPDRFQRRAVWPADRQAPVVSLSTAPAFCLCTLAFCFRSLTLSLRPLTLCVCPCLFCFCVGQDQRTIRLEETQPDRQRDYRRETHRSSGQATDWTGWTMRNHGDRA